MTARSIAESGWFRFCLALGKALRSARYSDVYIEHHDDRLRVLKRRRPYAPLLMLAGGALIRLLDTGVRVLAQREWEARELRLHRELRGTQVERQDGGLILPWLAGHTLAAMLERPDPPAQERTRSITLAVDALADLHERGVTHGDAMAENVMVDLDAGAAHWFDFETEHEMRRDFEWRRADDLRALVATIALRTAPGDLAATVKLVASVYGDDRIVRIAAASFASVLRRSLPFHLGQAALSHSTYREIARLLG